MIIFLLALLALSQPAHAQFSGGGGSVAAKAPLPSEELQKLCDGGTMAACDDLGARYFEGNGVPKDRKKSAALFQRACDGGDAIGCYDLAESYRFGDGVAKDMARAATYYLRACDGGDGKACGEMALNHADGSGVAIDEAKAALFADRACKLKNQSGCALLGMVYSQGVEGYPKDTRRAQELLTDACLKGAKFSEKPDEASRIACPALAKLTGKPSCMTEAIVGLSGGKRHCYDDKAGWVTTAVGNGAEPTGGAAAPAPPVGQLPNSAGNAANLAGLRAYNARDYGTALARYAEACDQGVAAGCGSLGAMYFTGTGVTRNGARAAAPLAKACDAGQTLACAQLAVLYDNADGVSVNKTLAFKLYGGACAKSDMASCHGLGRLYEKGQGTTANVAQAAALYQKACTAGLADGCSSVGAMYANGVHYPKSENQSEIFYKSACSKGSSKGCQLYTSLIENRRKRLELATALETSRRELLNSGNNAGGLRSCIEREVVDTSYWTSSNCASLDGVHCVDPLASASYKVRRSEVQQRNICAFPVEITWQIWNGDLEKRTLQNGDFIGDVKILTITRK